MTITSSRTKNFATLFLSCFMISQAFMMPDAEATRGTTTIEGPGFQLEQKQGWFGRKQHTYNDALGNSSGSKTGWFGRKKQETSILGNRMVQDGNNVTVENANGTPIITRKKSWWKGEETRINGNEILNSLTNILN